MKSFIYLVLGLLIPTFFICFILRTKGLNQRYIALNHPLNQTSPLFVLRPPASSGAEGLERVLATAPTAQTLIWLDVQQSHDEEFFVSAQDYIDPQLGRKGHIGWQAAADLDRRGLPRLEALLQRFPQQRWIVNVRANANNIDLRLPKKLKELGVTERLIFHSPFDIVLNSTRKENPRWAYGVGPAEFTRLAMFESIALEPVIPVKGDFLILDRKVHLQRTTDGVLKELKRRRKKVIVGPLPSLEAWRQWQARGAEGLIIEDLETFAELI